jgi:hypothetical protein
MKTRVPRERVWARKSVLIECATGVISVPWKSVVVAAALVLGAANMTTHAMAFGRGMSGGAHFVGRGSAGHRFAIVRPFRRNFAFRKGFAFRRTFATGGLWPYYGYDYFPTDAYGDINGTAYPETVGFVPEPPPAPVCHRSEEIVTVPSEGGGTRQIKIIRCP